MADVAVHAGVSAQTVSRVSNGFEGVSTETRESVLRSMRALGYRPNSAARALKRGEFRTLGVIAFSLRSSGNVGTVDAVAHAAASAGYAITLLPVATPTQQDVYRAFSRLEELAVDAVIVIVENHLLDAAHVVLQPGVPAVLVNVYGSDEHDSLAADQVAGARAATEHLLQLGHRTVWHISGPAESYAAERRQAAWREALTSAGRRVPPVLTGDWSAYSGYTLGRELAQREDCTAVFCANDQMALGLYRALSEAGLRVPQDVSVTGFDDIDDACAYDPPLTTVAQNFNELAERSVATVLRRLREPEAAITTISIDTHLIVRASAATAHDGNSQQG